MAVTLDATVGGANANTYLTLIDADALVDAMISSSDVKKWQTGADDSRNRALAAATQRLDREQFLGARSTNQQALQWPRIGVKRPDTYRKTYITGFPYRIGEDFFLETEVPEEIKRAQIELAVYLHNNPEGISLSGLEDYKDVSIGSISVTPNNYGATGADRIPPMVQLYLTGLRISGPGNISIRRS